MLKSGDVMILIGELAARRHDQTCVAISTKDTIEKMKSMNEICTISRNISHFSNFFRQIFSKSIEYLQFSAIPREIPTKIGQNFTERMFKNRKIHRFFVKMK